MAQIMLSREEYDTLMYDRRMAESRVAELEQKLEQVRLEDPSDRVPPLVACIRSALPIVQFALGNLDPTTVRGWPHEAVTAFAETIRSLPGADVTIHEMGLEFLNFARYAARVERDRAERDAKRIELARQPAAAVDAAVVAAAAAAATGQVMMTPQVTTVIVQDGRYPADD